MKRGFEMQTPETNHRLDDLKADRKERFIQILSDMRAKYGVHDADWAWRTVFSEEEAARERHAEY